MFEADYASVLHGLDQRLDRERAKLRADQQLMIEVVIRMQYERGTDWSVRDDRTIKNVGLRGVEFTAFSRPNP